MGLCVCVCVVGGVSVSNSKSGPAAGLHVILSFVEERRAITKRTGSLPAAHRCCFKEPAMLLARTALCSALRRQGSSLQWSLGCRLLATAAAATATELREFRAQVSRRKRTNRTSTGFPQAMAHSFYCTKQRSSLRTDHYLMRLHSQQSACTLVANPPPYAPPIRCAIHAPTTSNTGRNMHIRCCHHTIQVKRVCTPPITSTVITMNTRFRRIDAATTPTTSGQGVRAEEGSAPCTPL